MKDEKVVSVTVEIPKEIADAVGRSEHDALINVGFRVRTAIAAQHPPEPEVPDADWLVGEEDGVPVIALRGPGQWKVWTARGVGGATYSLSNMRQIRNLRALDLSALPGPGDEVLEGRVVGSSGIVADSVVKLDLDYPGGILAFPVKIGDAVTLIIRKSKGGGA